MDDEFDKVDDHPGVRLICIAVVHGVVVPSAKLLKLLGDGLHLPVARPRTDEQEIADLAEAPDIQKPDVFAVPISHQPRRFHDERPQSLRIGLGGNTHQPRPTRAAIVGEYLTMSPANTTDTIAMSLMRMFSEGPEVSLKGSPTVSPTTPALWASDPFPP